MDVGRMRTWEQMTACICQVPCELRRLAASDGITAVTDVVVVEDETRNLSAQPLGLRLRFVLDLVMLPQPARAPATSPRIYKGLRA